MSTGPEAVVVIGVGNPLRGDDGAGRAVARRLARASLPAGVAVLERDGEPTALMDAWEGARAVFLADAVVTGALPGTVHRFEAAEAPLPASLRGAASTHGLGVVTAIELARALGRLPARLVLYGIEAGQVEYAAPVAPAVDRAIDAVARRILDEARTA